MDAPQQFVVALQFDPASHALAVGSRSKDALIVDVTDPTRPTVRYRLTGFTTYVNSVAFSTDGARVVAGSSDNSTQIWDTASGAHLQTLPGPAVVTSVAFADRDGTVIDTSVDGNVHEWSLPGPVSASVADTIYVLQASRDGRTAIAGIGAKDNSLRQFDLADPSNVHEAGPRLQPPAGATLSGVAALSGGWAPRRPARRPRHRRRGGIQPRLPHTRRRKRRQNRAPLGHHQPDSTGPRPAHRILRRHLLPDLQPGWHPTRRRHRRPRNQGSGTPPIKPNQRPSPY